MIGTGIQTESVPLIVYITKEKSLCSKIVVLTFLIRSRRALLPFQYVED